MVAMSPVFNPIIFSINFDLSDLVRSKLVVASGGQVKKKEIVPFSSTGGP